ncbi:PDZ domain-containing protein [Nonomuraea sp. NPDC046570]|uniref:PDZ domain-containing protein n=1 Tax=Nonomuraea sp. NPDC046570 TaxID=3155255 RepID=UPI00340FE6EA
MTLSSLAEPVMGATVTEIHSDEVKSSVGLTDYDGLFLKTVSDDSYAGQKGLRTGDVIREIDGVRVTDRNSFWTVYNLVPAGRPMALKIWRNQALTDLSVPRSAAPRRSTTSPASFTPAPAGTGRTTGVKH